MWFIVPGPLDQITGGYLFDRRIVEGLRASGGRVEVIELPGIFPDADDVARTALGEALATLPDGAPAVLDGLALAAAEPWLEPEAARLRLVAFVHHPLALETGLPPAEAQRYAALERRLLPRFAGVVCPSPRTAAEVRAYGVERVEIAPPGIEKPDRLPARAEGGPIRLLSVATLTPRKGHLVLIDALAGLRDLDWRLTLIGSLDRDAATAAAVRARVATHGLEHLVTLTGEWPPSRLAEAYAAADVFVLPSFHEGYGMVFAEAMAWGLPIVATRAGAIPETVPPEAGRLVAPGDVPELAAALRDVIANAAMRGRLADAARAHAATLPSWPEAVARWAAAFDRLAA
jgi:glycosyltransferase involved in cell wall biosynthesis